MMITYQVLLELTVEPQVTREGVIFLIESSLTTAPVFKQASVKKCNRIVEDQSNGNGSSTEG